MDNDNMATEPPPPSPWPPPSASELIRVLDQATQMAKQLPTAAENSDNRHLILSSLHTAQVSLSNFLSLHHHPLPADNSVSSAGADEIMMEDDGVAEEEEDSKDSSMERVEEKMRESLYIQNKRPKRPLSLLAAAVAERWGLEERQNGSVRVPAEFDPHRTKLRNLELVYQFHG